MDATRLPIEETEGARRVAVDFGSLRVTERRQGPALRAGAWPLKVTDDEAVRRSLSFHHVRALHLI